jgi:hypothetical protein
MIIQGVLGALIYDHLVSASIPRMKFASFYAPMKSCVAQMSCCDWPWSKREDICIVYFASKGVYPEACAEIVHIFCHSKRHPLYIHDRISHLTDENALYCPRSRRFVQPQVQVWLEAQEESSFVRSLHFNDSVTTAIKRVRRETLLL